MRRALHTTHTARSGFGLIDALIGVVLFVLIALGLYQAYTSLTKLIAASTAKATAALILDEQIEILHNLDYEDIGVAGGIPNGILPQNFSVTRNDKTFDVSIIVRNIDDPFDGTLGGTPSDSSAADYKLVQYTISCVNCQNVNDLISTATIAPPGLEISVGNGALFVHVFDAVGQPVENATVHIEDNATTTPISFDDVTDANGWLRLVDVPPNLGSYEITVSKDGYSTDRTYAPGQPANPNPIKAHASVIADSITQVSFSIDKVSELTIETLDSLCGYIPLVDFALDGSKLIGADPDVLKYSQSHSTGGSGLSVLPAMEEDTYTLTLTDTTYFVAGSLPQSPLVLSPGTQQHVSMVLAPRTTNALLVDVQDAAAELPVAGAEVLLTGPGYSNTLNTGEGYWQQTDWSGGGGQETVGSLTQFADSSGSLDIDSPAGELKLHDFGSSYASSGWLLSSSFDNGTSTNYYHLTVHPQSQPPFAGADPVRIQIASNDDNTTWDFVGPDGTSNTYYTPADRTLNPIHSADRYIRYRVELSTQNTMVTPNVSDIAISFASECTPSGQAYFSDIGTGDYTLQVSAPGYETYSGDLSLQSGWQTVAVPLTPE